MTERAQRIVLASRPVGEPTSDNFRLEEVPIPQRGPGQMLLRTRWLSLDPYMRGTVHCGSTNRMEKISQIHNLAVASFGFPYAFEPFYSRRRRSRQRLPLLVTGTLAALRR
jgi:oxidoreductase family protein